MVARTQVDRRKAVARTFRLGRPLFIQVRKPTAALVLAACALFVITADHFAPPSIKLGSVFLLICAFAAWFIGNRFAVLLGALVVTMQYLNGHLIDIRTAQIDDVVDVAFRLGCALAVVLMLGVARVALEIEWRHARIDLLTGVLNRKAFFEALKARGKDENLTVLVFADLDGLKGLNDKLGHEQGDLAIRSFSQRVRSSIREHDIFARLGGDEFAILLDVPDISAAITVAERLHSAVNLRAADETSLKCSLGILLLPEGSKSIDSELRQADALMYEAKRNRTGFSIAMIVDENQDTLIQIASGLSSHELRGTAAKSNELRTLKRSLSAPENPKAA